MNLFRSCIFGNSALFICTLLWLNPLLAADIEAGKQRASACFGCHGPEGISLNPKYPNLAGQSAEYLASQLNAFRKGDRKDAIMSPMASSMSDSDVANVSAFFASQGMAAQKPLTAGGEREQITALAAQVMAAVEAMYQGAASGGDSLAAPEAQPDRPDMAHNRRCRTTECQPPGGARRIGIGKWQINAGNDGCCKYAFADINNNHANRKQPSLGPQRIGTAGIAATHRTDIHATAQITHDHRTHH